MGFIQSSFDIRKLCELLDRTKALPAKSAEHIVKDGVESTSFADLDDYIFTNIALPMIADNSIPIGKLDFDRISYEDIEKLAEAFENSQVCEFFGLCTLFDRFSPRPVERKILI